MNLNLFIYKNSRKICTPKHLTFNGLRPYDPCLIFDFLTELILKYIHFNLLVQVKDTLKYF